MSVDAAPAPLAVCPPAPVAAAGSDGWVEPRPARRAVRLALDRSGGTAALQVDLICLRERAPGLVVALLVAVAATSFGRALPVVGGPVFGLVLGVVVGVAVASGDRLRPGSTFASGPVLKCSIVVLGATLSLTQIVTVGLGSLPVMIGSLVVALVGVWVLGRLIGVRGDTQILIGVGTAICGASAIAAAGAVLRPKPIHVAYALGTIFALNIVAVLTFPAIGQMLGMRPQVFGLWAGTAINDTSSVVAAGYSVNPGAGRYALVVKLTRSLALIPIVIALALFAARREVRGHDGVRGRRTEFSLRALPWRKVVPLFLVGFVAAAGLSTLGVIPVAWYSGLTEAGFFLITVALAGIGLSVNVRDLRAVGHRPFLLGVTLWVLVALSSLGLMALTGVV